MTAFASTSICALPLWFILLHYLWQTLVNVMIWRVATRPQELPSRNQSDHRVLEQLRQLLLDTMTTTTTTTTRRSAHMAVQEVSGPHDIVLDYLTGNHDITLTLNSGYNLTIMGAHTQSQRKQLQRVLYQLGHDYDQWITAPGPIDRRDVHLLDLQIMVRVSQLHQRVWMCIRSVQLVILTTVVLFVTIVGNDPRLGASAASAFVPAAWLPWLRLVLQLCHANWFTIIWAAVRFCGGPWYPNQHTLCTLYTLRMLCCLPGTCVGICLLLFSPVVMAVGAVYGFPFLVVFWFNLSLVRNRDGNMMWTPRLLRFQQQFIQTLLDEDQTRQMVMFCMAWSVSCTVLWMMMFRGSAWPDAIVADWNMRLFASDPRNWTWLHGLAILSAM